MKAKPSVTKFIMDELFAPCDIDKTLVSECSCDEEDAIELNYYGTMKWYKPHKRNIEFLRTLKKRGYFIIVWSANGPQWVKEVVTKLKLTDVVNLGIVKPNKYIDDLSCEEWMGVRIDLKDDE
jgi:hypothetical protein